MSLMTSLCGRCVLQMEVEVKVKVKVKVKVEGATPTRWTVLARYCTRASSESDARSDCEHKRRRTEESR